MNFLWNNINNIAIGATIITAEALTSPQSFSNLDWNANNIVAIGLLASSWINVNANKNSFQTAKPTTRPVVKNTGH